MIKPITKKSISIRLDSDILDWFKSQGKGYQTLINRVLRSYVHHQQNQSLKEGRSLKAEGRRFSP